MHVAETFALDCFVHTAARVAVGDEVRLLGDAP
jgi:hypothetical protein